MPAWCSNAIRIDQRVLSLALLLTMPLSAGAASGASSLLGDSGDFLPVDEAFAFHVSLDSDQRISVHFQVAEAYYLYRQSLQFRILMPDDTQRGIEPELPEGTDHHDEFFGDVEVYYETLTAGLPLPRGLPSTVTLELEFQGCAEAGLCYPPQTRRIELML